MARHRFGGVADYVISVGTGNAATLQPSVSVTCWNAAIGGTQYTDLTQTDGATPIDGGILTTDSAGAVPEFFGPDGVSSVYLDANGGSGPRRRTTATDVSDDLDTLMSEVGIPGGIATLDDNGVVDQAQIPSTLALTSKTAYATKGVYAPPGWGEFWKPKRDAAASSGARVVIAGDSLSQGYFASNLHTTSWVGLVRQALQSSYGDGGSGFFSISRSSAVMSADPAALAAWQANQSIASLTGTWTLGGINFGPGITYVTANAAATATFKVTGSTVKIFNISGAAPRAAFTYSIDGGAAVPVTVPITATQIQTTTVTGLTNADHTVVISWNGAAGDVLYLVGVSGENPTGVIVDNLARAGSRTSHWYTGSALNAPWNGGTSYPADLVIASLGVNDAANSVVAADWLNNFTGYLQAVRAAHNGATDLLLLLHHVGNYGGATAANLYGQYSAHVRGLAEAYGATLIDLWALGRNSWDYYNSLGYWGNGVDPGPAGTDLVHLSDAGHAYIADQIIPFLTA